MQQFTALEITELTIGLLGSGWLVKVIFSACKSKVQEWLKEILSPLEERMNAAERKLTNGELQFERIKNSVERVEHEQANIATRTADTLSQITERLESLVKAQGEQASLIASVVTAQRFLTEQLTHMIDRFDKLADK